MSETGNTPRSEVTRQVLEAADRLVAAFGEGRVDDYFACFHPQATFIFLRSAACAQEHSGLPAVRSGRCSMASRA